MNNYAYVRVSTKDQNEDRQLDAMRELPVPPENLFIDKQSGKDFDRPAWLAMVDRLEKGDCLFIKSIDRMGRDYKEILEQWRVLTHVKEVDIVVLDMPLLDTRREKNLLGTFISDLVLTLLSYVAETERRNIKTRQAEGIAAARARGVRFGKPPRPRPDGYEEISWLVDNRDLTLTEGAKILGISISTLRFWMGSDKQKEAVSQ